jgi:hypothetical protein
MKETQKTLNEELNVIKKMMGLNEDIAKYQFAKDIQDDSDYVQFKKDAIYKDDRDQEWSYGTPRADGNDPFVTKSKKWDRVKPDDLNMGDEIGDDVDEATKDISTKNLSKERAMMAQILREEMRAKGVTDKKLVDFLFKTMAGTWLYYTMADAYNKLVEERPELYRDGFTYINQLDRVKNRTGE